MKKIKTFLVAFIVTCTIVSSNAQIAEYSDIDRFWKAYDLIQQTSDSSEQAQILQSEYIDKGTLGLKAIMEKRGYTLESYLHAINNYPSFWNSIRPNTHKAHQYAKDIEMNVSLLKKIYPDLKPAQIFFTVGALRTGGTAYNGHVLIGAEIAMADSTVVTDEIEPQGLRENLHHHFCCNPIDDLVLLNIHEYVHTQQGDYGNDLLSMSIFEGVAEFVSCLASGKPSAAPAIPFGKKNEPAIKERFQKEMFSPNWNDWLYNNRENEFGVRDLGYYVGYAICEAFYHSAKDKYQAIKEMIELDCTDATAVKVFVEKSNYLSNEYDLLKKEFNAQLPFVKEIKEITSDGDIEPSIKQITIQFSREMNPRFRNFKLGVLGADHVLPVSSFEWSDDNTKAILGVELEADKQYQIVVSNEFRDMDGRPIRPYLIDIKTSMN